MRLIDADNFKKRYCKETCGDRRCVDDFDGCIFIVDLDEQPTAYDVDKVLEQLEERTEFLRNCKKYGNQTKEEKERSHDTMMMYEVAELVEDLIDIVKGGGIDG